MGMGSGEAEVEGELREALHFHVLIHCPDTHNGRDWVGLGRKPLSENTIRVSPVVSRNLLVCHCCLLGSALSSGWSQELVSNPGTPVRNAALLFSFLTARPKAPPPTVHPMAF